MRIVGGLAAILAGLLMAAHGMVQAVGGPDLDILPFALALLVLGLYALHRRLHAGGGQLEKASRILVGVALWVAAVEIVSGAVVAVTVSVPALDDSVLTAAWPVHAVSLALTFVAILITLPVLGVAAFLTDEWPMHWRWVPLAVGMFWIVLFKVGEVFGDLISPDRELGLGFVPVGLAWILLGVLIAGRRPAVAQPAAAS